MGTNQIKDRANTMIQKDTKEKGKNNDVKKKVQLIV